MSRQGAPVRRIQNIALTIGRFGRAGRAFRPRSAGKSGRIFSHCVGLNSWRRLTHVNGTRPAQHAKLLGDFENAAIVAEEIGELLKVS